jgi:hypothetical protein
MWCVDRKTCLLCETGDAPVTCVSSDVWQIRCHRCGDYRFDSAFAELVKHARATRGLHVLRDLTRLASAVQNADHLLTLRVANYAALADEFD